MAQFLRLNGKVPRKLDEWKNDLGKLGTVYQSTILFSTSPQHASLETPRVVLVVDPAGTAARRINLSSPLTVAGLLQKDGTLSDVEFIGGGTSGALSYPRFGIIERGVPLAVSSQFCFSCHKNHAFLFPEFDWANTLVNPGARDAYIETLRRRNPKLPFFERLAALDSQLGKDRLEQAAKNREKGLPPDLPLENPTITADTKAIESLLATIHLSASEIELGTRNIDGTLTGANRALQMQSRLEQIPDAKVRGDVTQGLTELSLLRAMVDSSVSDSLDAQKSKDDLADRIRALYRPLLASLGEQPYPTGTHVVAYRLPQDEQGILDFNRLLVSDRTAALAKMVEFPTTDPRAIQVSVDPIEANGFPDPATPPVTLTNSEMSQLLGALKGGQRADVVAARLEKLLGSPSLRSLFEQGHLPSREQLLDVFSQLPGFRRAPRPVLCTDSSPSTAAGTSSPVHCAECHMGDNVPPGLSQLEFPVDPTDAESRDRWFSRNGPAVVSRYLGRFWCRAILRKDMPPRTDHGRKAALTEKEYEDLRSFLEHQARSKGLSLPTLSDCAHQ